MESYPEDYPGGMMEGYPDSEYFDGWGWEDDVVPVPGFGFFPSVMKEELEEEAEDFLREVRVNLLKKCQHYQDRLTRFPKKRRYLTPTC